MNAKILSYRVVILGTYLVICVVFLGAFPQDAGHTRYFYLCIISMAVLCAWVAQAEKSKNIKRFFYVLSFLILLFVLGLRDMSGIDDKSYYHIFSNACNMDFKSFISSSGTEIGFKFFVYITSKFTKNYYIYQFIFTFIPLSIFYKGLWNYRGILDLPSAILLFISLYYFQMLSVSLVRMFFAIMIIFYSLRFIMEKNRKRFILFVIIAGLFHISALFMIILLLFTVDIKDFWKKHWKKILLLIVVIIPITNLSIVRILVPYLPNRYNVYNMISAINISFGSFDKLFFVMIALFFINKIEESKREYLNLGIVLLTISILFSVFSFIGGTGRMQYYGNLGMFFCLPVIYRSLDYRKLLSLVIAGGIMIYSFLYLWVTQFNLPSHYERLIPYIGIMGN